RSSPGSALPVRSLPSSYIHGRRLFSTCASMSRAAMKSALALLVLVLTFAVAAGANAAIVTSTDAQGRRITFDVRAASVDTDWYAAVLRATAHGNEISNVTIRIVPDQSIDTTCGNEAAACYTRASGKPTIIVPAGKNT